MQDEEVPREIFESRGYQIESHGQKTYNGVAIASRIPMVDIHRGLEGGDAGQSRLIAATLNGIRFYNLYCPQGKEVGDEKFEYKLNFFEVLTQFLASTHKEEDYVVVAGDLNIAPLPDDVWSVEEMANQVSYHSLEHRAWAKLLALGLHDAVKPYVPSKTFTFWDYRQMSFRRKRGMRIDHFLVTSPIQERVLEASVYREERAKEKPSDHAPVEMILE